MGLTSREYELVTFIEQEWLLTSALPSKDRCLTATGLSPKKYDDLIQNLDFRKALEIRGISANLYDEAKNKGTLTKDQLLVINTLLDVNDTRSDAKKLKDLGIATSTYQGWQRDPIFAAYMRERTEALFGDALTEAPRALYDNVRRGDLGSIKQVFEMTGRWSSKPVSEMNIEWILMKVIEVLQQEITDGETLSRVAERLSAIQQEAVPQAPFASAARTTPALVPGRADTQQSPEIVEGLKV